MNLFQHGNPGFCVWSRRTHSVFKTTWSGRKTGIVHPGCVSSLNTICIVFFVPYSLVLTKWMTGCGGRRLSRAKCEHMVLCVKFLGCYCVVTIDSRVKWICVNSRYGTKVKQDRGPGSQTSTSSSWERCVELIDLCLGGPVQVWVL